MSRHLPRKIGLVADPAVVPLADLNDAAHIIQTQVTRDFATIWDAPAIVGAFDPRKLPHEYDPFEVVASIDDPGALGYHDDAHGQPYAKVLKTDDWIVTSSHETLETLGDPFGRHFTPGDSVVEGQGRVKYLIEVCDPPEAATYTIEGVKVSDFVLPRFYGPHRWHYHNPEGTATSFTGYCKRPFEVAPGGYLSWYVPDTRQWWQRTFFGGSKPTDRDVTSKVEARIASGMNPRQAVDHMMRQERSVH